MGVCANLDVVRRCAPSTVAAVIHAASDQVLRQPEQTDETGCDDQQIQDSSVSRELKTTQRANEPSLNCWPLKACADATAPGCSGPCGFAGGSHRTSVDRPAVVLSQRCMVVDTPEQHLDDWNRCPRCCCGGGFFAGLSRLACAGSQASPIRSPWDCSGP